MDPRFQVTYSPRKVGTSVVAEMPLVTIAWRVLRAEYRRRRKENNRRTAETKRVQDAYASIAEEVYRLRRMTEATHATSNMPMVNDRPFLSTIERLESIMDSVDLAIVAPEGEVFTTELMELLENVAQQPESGICEPYVVEVITPAIIHQGALLRMGKAVIAVPSGQDSQAVLDASEESGGEADHPTTDLLRPSVETTLKEVKDE